jgi:mycobactin salicyl-AMP ligase
MAIAVAGGDELTYAALEGRANALGRELAARGAAGTRVALLLNTVRWTDFAVAYLGVHKAGVVPVLLSPGAAPADMRRALAASEAAGLLCPPDRVPAGVSPWTASVDEVGAGHDPGPVDVEIDRASDVAWAPDPLAPARFDTGLDVAPLEGDLVHAWAPDTVGARW